MTGKYGVWFLIFLLAVSGLQACSSSSEPSKGALSLSLSDAATSDYKAVYVTIKEVQVHRAENAEGVWNIAASPNKTYNLLNLVNGVVEQLGLSSLESGTYTQMRMIIGDEAAGGSNILGQDHPYANYFIDASGISHELKIPSGYQTGIKLVHEFGIVEGLTTELVLDFDVEKSIVKSGDSGNFQMKPTIKVISTINKAVLSGVAADGTGTPIPGARISVQKHDQTTQEVSVYASTLTTDDGEYQMYLEPGLYTVVAYKDGYAPVCSVIMTGSNEYYEQSFVLSNSAMSAISCIITLPQSLQDQVVELHFLRTPPCDETTLIEVKVLNVSQSGTYQVEVPAGTYVARVAVGTTTLANQAITAGNTLNLDFTSQLL